MENKINYKFTIGYVCTVALGFFNLGYCYAYFNTLTMIVHPQFVYHNKTVIEDIDLFNSVVSSLIPFGAIFGAPIGGVLVTKGRRTALIWITMVFGLACMFTSIFHLYPLIIGRFIMGVCIGAYVTAIPVAVSELSPKSISGPLGVIGQLMCVSGVLFALSLGFLVPYADHPNVVTTSVWRYLYRMPALVALLQLSLFMFVFKYDTPAFYEMQNDQVGYQNSMN